MKARFTWSDAWVLAAVVIGGGHGNELRDIIAAGDLINRELFTPQELRRGLAKLMHEGHVRAAKDTFVVAGEAVFAAERFVRENRSSYELMQLFEVFLDAEPYPAGDRDAEDPSWPLAEMSDERVAAACEAYRLDLRSLHKDAKNP